MTESNAERSLATLLAWDGLPTPEREYRFHPSRKWRFDFAFPSKKVAVEVDGGSFISGRHSRGAGFEADAEKLSEAAAHGWRVIRCTPRQIEDGRALWWIRRALEYQEDSDAAA